MPGDLVSAGSVCSCSHPWGKHAAFGGCAMASCLCQEKTPVDDFRMPEAFFAWNVAISATTMPLENGYVRPCLVWSFSLHQGAPMPPVLLVMEDREMAAIARGVEQCVIAAVKGANRERDEATAARRARPEATDD